MWDCEDVDGAEGENLDIYFREFNRVPGIADERRGGIAMIAMGVNNSASKSHDQNHSSRARAYNTLVSYEGHPFYLTAIEFLPVQQSSPVLLSVDMTAVEKAIEALRTAVHKNGVDRHVKDTFSHLTSCMVLLNSSAPSLQAIKKLRSVLRQPLLPLYEACFQPTLQLSSAVLFTILEKLCGAYNHDDASSRAGWDAIADVILSGVLDLLEQKPDEKLPDGKFRATVGEILYPVICNSFFPDASQHSPTLSIPLCLSAYNSLTEATLGCVANQDALRDRALLGGERLGTAISRSRDYLLIEALLTLFARLLPPTNNTTQGKFKRTKFVKEVLGSPKLFKCNAELLDIMHNISSTDWDDTAAQIIDALARSDITYPQPFSVAQIDICGRVFPQPAETDRLIMDRLGFLANVVLENDDPCESLQVPYAHIRTVTIDNSRNAAPEEKVLITVDLTSPSLVGNVDMKLPAGSSLYAKFMLESDALSRFMETLRRRGVGKLSFVNSLPKMVKPRKSISLAKGIKFTDGSCPLPPAASLEDKVKHVKAVYKTNTEGPMTSAFIPVSDASKVVSLPSTSVQPAIEDEKPLASLHFQVNQNASVTSKQDETAIMLVLEKRGPVSCSSGDSSMKAMEHLIFGESDAELSDISDIEPENNFVKKPGREKKLKLVVAAISRTPVSERKAPKRIIKRKQVIDTDDEISGTSTTKEGNESAQSNSKAGDDTREIVEKPLETSEPPFTGGSSRVGRSSTDFSEPLAEADLFAVALPLSDAKVAGSQPTGSNGPIVPDPRALKGPNNFDGCPGDGRLILDSATKETTRVTSSEEKPEWPSNRQITAVGAKRNKMYSPAKAGEETEPPPRIAGSRRKRDKTKAPGELATVDAEDELAPPQKRSRKVIDEGPGATTDQDTFGQRLTSLERVTTTTVRLTKRYGKKAKASSSPYQLNDGQSRFTPW
ncbi:hypothetical protein BU15DRAFT_70658 [Melanogaster broomeanus]|nr:hypothetical protein BU15DRAFT_70658 [Melanogaster broomeanus]